jgi:hypothetical protein
METLTHGSGRAWGCDSPAPLTYRVTNWAEYDKALVQRGDITLWISEDAVDAWAPKRSGKRGAPRKYSDLAIETALTLRLVYGLPLRQAEGFLRSLLNTMGLDLGAPDHTTLSRRSRQLNIALTPNASTEPIDLIVDSTGLSIAGQGEWAAAKHGKRGKRGWRKLHIGVNGEGEIVAQVLTDGNVDDAKTGVELIEQVEGDIKSVTGDAACDTAAVYDAVGARGAIAVVPPVRRAVVFRSKLPLSARDKTVLKVNMLGRGKWKKESGYHRQGRVENSFFRHNQTLGGKLRARHARAQEVEAVLACRILNRMHALGMPKSVAVVALRLVGWGTYSSRLIHAPTCARPSLEEGNDESLKLLLESHGDITRPDKARQPNRKRVLRGIGRPVLRSVDSECVGRVIQPREHYLPARADGVLVPEGYLRSTALSWCCGPRRGP